MTSPAKGVKYPPSILVTKKVTTGFCVSLWLWDEKEGAWVEDGLVFELQEPNHSSNGRWFSKNKKGLVTSTFPTIEQAWGKEMYRATTSLLGAA